jgi:hypothetical protein
MVTRRAIGKIELAAIVLVATAAVPGRWADAAEQVSAAYEPEPEAVATETMGCYADPPASVWYFGADALALKRDGVSHLAFASLVTRNWVQSTSEPPVWSSTQSAETALSTGDVDFGYRGGWEAMIGRVIGDRSAIEVSYFGLSDASDTATVVDQTPFQLLDPTTDPIAASLFSPFTDLDGEPVVGLDYNNLVSISYSSSLYGLEWNLRRRLLIPAPCVQGSVLIGGRYMDLRERFSYYSESDLPSPGGATNWITTGTKNDMVGAQIGAEFNFQVEPRCWVDCEIKGAIFDNAARQETVYVNQSAVADYAGTHTGSRGENTSAFALDLSLNLTYECNSFATLRVGYEALWLDGLALAAENVGSSADILVSGAANLVSDGRVVYHGPRLGVTCAW